MIVKSLLVAAILFVQEPANVPTKKHGPVTIEQIKYQVPQSSGILSFVTWLHQWDNVSEVDYNYNAFLISDPPQQWVRFSLDGERYRLSLRVLHGARLALVTVKRLR